MKRGASLTFQFHRWRGIGLDRQQDFFIRTTLNLGWVSVWGYGGVLDQMLKGFYELLLWARKEQERDGR